MTRDPDICLRNHPGLDLYLDEQDARRVRKWYSAHRQGTGTPASRVRRCPSCGYFYVGASKQPAGMTR